MKLEEGILKFSDPCLAEFKFLIMGEIEREKSIKYRYPDNIESLVNLGLTMAFGIILGTDTVLVDNESEFANAIIRKIAYKKKAISEDQDVIFIDPCTGAIGYTSYILLGMDTACYIVKEMLDKANGD